jgi:heme-degrading monooxygenase HmoA
LFQEQTLPQAEKTPGFKGSYFLADRKSGRIIVIALWESAKDTETSAERAKYGIQRGIETAGASEPAVVENYEVAVQPAKLSEYGL